MQVQAPSLDIGLINSIEKFAMDQHWTSSCDFSSNTERNTQGRKVLALYLVKFTRTRTKPFLSHSLRNEIVSFTFFSHWCVKPWLKTCIVPQFWLSDSFGFFYLYKPEYMELRNCHECFWSSWRVHPEGDLLWQFTNSLNCLKPQLICNHFPNNWGD